MDDANLHELILRASLPHLLKLRDEHFAVIRLAAYVNDIRGVVLDVTPVALDVKILTLVSSGGEMLPKLLAFRFRSVSGCTTPDPGRDSGPSLRCGLSFNGRRKAAPNRDADIPYRLDPSKSQSDFTWDMRMSSRMMARRDGESGRSHYLGCRCHSSGPRKTTQLG